MRIHKIKLAGFKSFVDPTTLELPGNVTGIVGPNGCGKSNIIDGMLWVLGESSAKHLRGDSMEDVIFNGSGSRKPVGQASVEIIFDNSDGALGGPYAGYNEIAIKRQLSRDGLSLYFLNGARCRRRDITGMFLGTGVGSRSYSVIEQGMISRIIEAKPEDLRVFLEEAAGISKYKERRRETETRIRHTKENLNRLNDIREELEKQLNRLQRQAAAARQYQKLKEEERRLKAELHALRWRALKTEHGTQERTSAERATAVEGAVAELRGIEAALERLRQEQTAANEAFNQVQGRYYAAGADIARLEQAIQHGRERREATERDLGQIRRDLELAREHRAVDQEHLDTLLKEIGELQPRAAECREAERAASRQLHEAEQAMHVWQAEWDQFNQHASESARNEQVEQTRLEHLEAGLEESRRRLQVLRGEREQLDVEPLSRGILARETELADLDADHQRLQQDLDTRLAELRAQREQVHASAAALDRCRSEQQQLRGRLASLQALQQSALGKDQSPVLDWLKVRGLAELPRLAQELNVESGWETAVETVLQGYLDAVCVDDAVAMLSDAAAIESGALALVDRGGPAAGEGDGPSLAARVSSAWPVRALLSAVRIAESLEDAVAMRPGLQAHESVVTRDGTWLGPGWLRVSRGVDPKAGVIQREREIRELERSAAALAGQAAELGAQVEDGRGTVHRLEEAVDGLRMQLAALAQRREGLGSDLAGLQARLEQTEARIRRIETDMAELEDQSAVDSAEIGAARRRLSSTQEELAGLEARRSALGERRDALAAALQTARDEWRGTREESHALALRLEALASNRSSLEQSLARNQQRVAELEQRSANLEAALAESAAPEADFKNQLERALESRMVVEGELTATRSRVQELDTALREREQARSAAEQTIDGLRQLLEEARVAVRDVEVRLQGAREQLEQTGLGLEEILGSLAEDAAAQDWEERLGAQDRKIQRLGPINLAAIDEFAELSERKDYLDRQHADLSEAMDTLESAIQKIDRETRARFKETYDKVNAGLQAMFPRLFGGGHAYLELTGENLLETGVAVMARPPGKQNSTIHLLSGGEKALTALALVFAIFELNPAPFCLLDEVDAPLDDANVVRLCEMLRSMSERVQFLFVTHNKITMEIAQQLVGVTMHEPGVSRLVAVDIDAAVELAATG